MCSPTTSTSSSQRPKIAAVIAAISVLILIAVLHRSGLRSKINGYNVKKLMNYNNNNASPHRKLMTPKRSVDKPARFWGGINEKCTADDIVVNQGPGAPLPSGIPTYTVVIINTCATGCNISDIHIHCGWFSSARLIDPLIFKRIHHNNCLVNGGQTLQNGESISFQYANTHSYPLAISALSCV